MTDQNEHQHHSAHEENPSQEHDILHSDHLEHKKDQMAQQGEIPGEGSDSHHQHVHNEHPSPEQDNPEKQAEHAMQSEPEQAHGAGHGVETAIMMDEANNEHAQHAHSHHTQQPAPDTGNAMAIGHGAMHAGHGESAGQEEHSGHGAHVDHIGHEQMFRKRFWISLVLSIPVLLYSQGLQMLLGYSMPAFPGSQWIAPIFSVIVFAYGGVPFIQMALPELQTRQPGMMTLISLAIGVAFIYSVATLFLPGQMDFFWELVTLIDIMLLGHWIEMRSVRQASGALDALAKLMPDTADRIGPNGQMEQVSVSELRQNDLVLIAQ